MPLRLFRAFAITAAQFKTTGYPAASRKRKVAPSRILFSALKRTSPAAIIAKHTARSLAVSRSNRPRRSRLSASLLLFDGRVVDQHRDGVGVVVARGQVWQPIAVKAAHRHGNRTAAHAKAPRG